MALNPSLQDFVLFTSSIPQVETWGYYKFVPAGTWGSKFITGYRAFIYLFKGLEEFIWRD